MADMEELMNTRDREEGIYDSYIRPCLSELVGTTLFVFIGTLSVDGALVGQTIVYENAVVIALAHGLTLAIMVANFGQISGGHFNPAVTLGVTIGGGIKPALAACYVVSQLIGAILGAALMKGSMPAQFYKNISAGGHTLGMDVDPGQGILCEIVMTIVLVLTVLMSAVDKRNKHVLAPLVIGFAVAVDILAGVLITGASMNPARSFGPAVVFSSVSDNLWKYHYVYWVGPAVGALISGLLFRLLLGSSEHRLILKKNQ